MKIKILASAILITSMFAGNVFALTQDDINLLIAAGFIPADKVSQARSAVSSTQTQTQTQNSSSKTNQTSQTNQSAAQFADQVQGSCLKLVSDLGNGMSSSVVSELQSFLKSKGHFFADVTGYFGSVTQDAVASFQKAEGVVLNGTPETTGLGRVGPATRNYIEKLTCASTGSSSSTGQNILFGYDLDELLNYKPDLGYNPNLNYNADLSYNSDLSYVADLGYRADLRFESLIDYDVDLNYNAPISYNADLSFSTGQKNAKVLLYAKALNGEFLRGGNKVPVAVASDKVELQWISEAARDNCTLSGDYKDKKLSVPLNGTAQVTLEKPSRRSPSGESLYEFKIHCPVAERFAFDANDTALIWIAPNGTTPTVQ